MMKYEIDETIRRLIHLPHELHRINTVSIIELLRESSYFDNYNNISVENIHDALNLYPECVNEWMQYSEDKRASSGFYIKQEECKKYIIGFINVNGNHNFQPVVYDDRIEACAFFIKKEAESIRK